MRGLFAMIRSLPGVLGLASFVISAAVATGQEDAPDVAVLVRDEIRKIDVTDAERRTGKTWRFRYTTESPCRLRIWARGDDLDPTITVTVVRPAESKAKRKYEDDDSGGKPAAYIEARDVAAKTAVTIDVSVKPLEKVAGETNPAPTSSAVLHLALFELRRDPDLDANVARWKEEVTRAHKLCFESGKRREAHSIVEKIITECEEAGVVDDVEVAERIFYYAGYIANGCGDPRLGLRAHQPRLEQCRRTMSPDHPALQIVIEDVAVCMAQTGRAADAEPLLRQVLAVRERVLPPDHSNTLNAMGTLASTLHVLGRREAATTLFRRRIEGLERSGPGDDRVLQSARFDLGVSYYAVGRTKDALDLHLSALEVRERVLPPEHPEIALSRGAVAACLKMEGRYNGARVLERQALEILKNTLPDKHPSLQNARLNLASTLSWIGRDVDAFELRRRVVDVLGDTVPEDHPMLQVARAELARSLMRISGQLEAATVVFEDVVDVFEQTRPKDDGELQSARLSLAWARFRLGDQDDAVRLSRQAVECLVDSRPVDCPILASARSTLAVILAYAGCFEDAYDVQRLALDSIERTAGSDISAARHYVWLAGLAETVGRPVIATSATTKLYRCLRDSFRRRRATTSERDLIGFVRASRRCLDVYFSSTGGLRDDVANEFAFVEEWSNVATFARRREKFFATDRDPKRESKASELRTVERKLEELLRAGRTDAVGELEGRRGRLRVQLREMLEAQGQGARDVVPSEIAAHLESGTVAVRFFSYFRVPEAEKRFRLGAKVHSHWLAYVLRSDGSVQRVELGLRSELEQTITAYREAVQAEGQAVTGAARRGEATLRRKTERDLFDRLIRPLMSATGDAKRWILALDSMLHVVPWEALTLADGKTRLGERVRIEYRTTLRELAMPLPPLAEGDAGLVAFGGLDFDAVDDGKVVAKKTAPRRATPISALASMRGGEGRFRALAASRGEVDSIAKRYRSAFGKDATSAVLTGGIGTREKLEVTASKARYLHLATHAYYLPSKFNSTASVESSASAIHMSPFSARKLAGEFLPHALCGIALSGSNLEFEEERRGLFDRRYTVSGTDVSHLDLRHCDLVVLSACEGNVGMTGTASGSASLQDAFQIAGARSVVSALWPVPDSVTKDLMIAFYDELWSKKKTKAEALRAAKRKFRDAKDDKGRPKYVVRDWAGWVLTGEPK